MAKVELLFLLLFFVLGLVQLTPTNAWISPRPVQSIFLKKTLKTIVVFIPEKDSSPHFSSDEAAELVKSVFEGYGVTKRYNEYSSGAIIMTGVESDTQVTMKYIDEGIDTCDREKIVDAVKDKLSKIKYDRLIIISNTNEPECPGLADAGDDTVMGYNILSLNPAIMFHELGHTLSLDHPGTDLCYSKHKKVAISNNCTTIDHEEFQNMGEIPHDAPWFKDDGVTNAEGAVKGILEYSSYYRLSSKWPMLNESNVLDFTGNGTYNIYNSKNSTIGDKTATVRIPLNPPIKISKDMVSEGISYHTHYYVDFSQRRKNTDEGGYYNYIVIRSAPDHRAKPSIITRLMPALSEDDDNVETSYFDNIRNIRITIDSIDDDGAAVKISVPSNYTPSVDVNNCYFSSVISDNYVVSAGNTTFCRANTVEDMRLVGTSNGTACFTVYGVSSFVTNSPDVEYLHCSTVPKWISIKDSEMEGFDFFGIDDNYICRTTYNDVQYYGRGSQTQCCFYYNNAVQCVQKDDDSSAEYLSWLSL